MNFMKLPNYNLESTLLGGQAFNWDYINGSFYGFTTSRIIKITPATDGIFWQTYPEKDNTLYIKNLLNSKDNFDTILTSINKDPQIALAIESIKNVQILKQDFEQTLFSFILTAHKNIKAVRKVVRQLSRKYGTKYLIDDLEFYTFPSSEVIATLSEEQIKECGAGFRAKYLIQAAKVLSANKNIERELMLKTEQDARQELLKFNGIGDKVADCILTFALGFYTVTPIDIWAQRVLLEFYNLNIKFKYSELRKWYFDYFGEHTAYAGQFLFEYLRENYKSIKKVT